MINKAKISFLVLSIVSLAVFTSCEPEEGKPASKPWNEDFTFGNFTVNSVNVVTNFDGYSANYQADYVFENALPTADWGILTMNIYVPTEEGYFTTLTDVSAVITLESGAQTGNLFSSEYSSFLQQTTLGSQLYSVYQIYAVYPAGGTIINASNFANIVFSMSAEYEKNNSVVATKSIGVEVFKAN